LLLRLLYHTPEKKCKWIPHQKKPQDRLIPGVCFIVVI